MCVGVAMHSGGGGGGVEWQTVVRILSGATRCYCKNYQYFRNLIPALSYRRRRAIILARCLISSLFISAEGVARPVEAVAEAVAVSEWLGLRHNGAAQVDQPFIKPSISCGRD